jgi:hypothetical protein
MVARTGGQRTQTRLPVRAIRDRPWALRPSIASRIEARRSQVRRLERRAAYRGEDELVGCVAAALERSGGQLAEGGVD